MQQHLAKQKIINLLKHEFREQINPLLKILSDSQKPYVDFVNSILEISQQLQRTDDIIYLLRSAIQESPRTCILYNLLISYLIRQQKYSQAEWWWGISLKIDPLCADLWLLGVELALARQDLQEAHSYLERAQHLIDDDQDPRLAQAQASIDLWHSQQALLENKIDSALFWARRATVHAPHWEKPRQQLDSLLKQLKQSQHTSFAQSC